MKNIDRNIYRVFALTHINLLYSIKDKTKKEMLKCDQVITNEKRYNQYEYSERILNCFSYVFKPCDLYDIYDGLWAKILGIDEENESKWLECFRIEMQNYVDEYIK